MSDQDLVFKTAANLILDTLEEVFHILPIKRRDRSEQAIMAVLSHYTTAKKIEEIEEEAPKEASWSDDVLEALEALVGENGDLHSAEAHDKAYAALKKAKGQGGKQ